MKKNTVVFIIAIVCICLCIPIGILVAKSINDKQSIQDNKVNDVTENNNEQESMSGEEDYPYYVSDELELKNIDSKTAIDIYDKIISMGIFIDEYSFDNAHNNNNWDYYGLYETNFPIWYIATSELLVSGDLSNDLYQKLNKNITERDLTYELTKDVIYNTDIKDKFYEYFSTNLEYKVQDVIYPDECRIGIYQKDQNLYAIYQSTASCARAAVIESLLLKVEKEGQYVYLYEENLKTSKQYKYTLILEGKEYKVLKREQI